MFGFNLILKKHLKRKVISQSRKEKQKEENAMNLVTKFVLANTYGQPKSPRRPIKVNLSLTLEFLAWTMHMTASILTTIYTWILYTCLT